MPFKSTSQRAYLHAKHPEVAKKFEAETPKGKTLPKHVTKHADDDDHDRRALAHLMKG